MSCWKSHLKATFPRPTEADRARLEALAGATSPDRYWHLVSEHQGQVLSDAGLELPGKGEINFGVLLALSLEAFGKEWSSYCIEDCHQQVQDNYSVGLFPFANDTGGSYWAFDFRDDATNPGVVFVDHERMDEEGMTRAADSFGAFMALAGMR